MKGERWEGRSQGGTPGRGTRTAPRPKWNKAGRTVQDRYQVRKGIKTDVQPRDVIGWNGYNSVGDIWEGLPVRDHLMR